MYILPREEELLSGTGEGEGGTSERVLLEEVAFVEEEEEEEELEGNRVGGFKGFLR